MCIRDRCRSPEPQSYLLYEWKGTDCLHRTVLVRMQQPAATPGIYSGTPLVPVSYTHLMAGGDGEVTIKRILGEKELNGKCGLYAQVTIQPGSSLSLIHILSKSYNVLNPLHYVSVQPKYVNPLCIFLKCEELYPPNISCLLYTSRCV